MVDGQIVFGLQDGVTSLTSLIRDKLKLQETVVVCVAGGSASGKTSKVADMIVKNFGDDAVLLSGDNYYHGIEFMQACWDRGEDINWDHPRAVDLDLLMHHIESLMMEQSIPRFAYDFSTGIRVVDKSNTEINAKRVIVVEGLFVLSDNIAKLGDVNVFVEIGTHGRLMRRLIRDVTRSGQKRIEILRMFTDTVQPMHDEHIEVTKKNARFVIMNEYNPETEAKKFGCMQRQRKFQATFDEDVLINLGAERLAAVIQDDAYMIPIDSSFENTDELLRIREESSRYVLTYKGPRTVDADSIQRPFIQFEIDAELMNHFGAYYKNDSLMLTKNRVIYLLDGVVFSLDYVCILVPDDSRQDFHLLFLGEFVEVRGQETVIEPILEKLGLKISDAITKSYCELARTMLGK